MSTLQKTHSTWGSIPERALDSKYEKCRNITEEIYKRINITFQIKKLETASQSDISDQSDCSQLDSNETDLFACDKSDSLSSSAGASDNKSPVCNRPHSEKRPPVCKRPRKRFRKRVKKRSAPGRARSESESDEPLSRIVEFDLKSALERRPIVRDLKPKLSPEKNQAKKYETKPQTVDKTPEIKPLTIDKGATIDLSMKIGGKTSKPDWNCTMCSLTFKGERGLRRHVTMSHISPRSNN